MLAAMAFGILLALSDVAPPPPAPLQTALLSAGFVQLKLSDEKDAPSFSARLSDPSGFLAAKGNFKGDGVQDQAGILVNDQRGVAYVVVSSIGEKADTYVVEQMPLSQAYDTGLRLAKPANGRADGLTIFSFSTGATETYDLLGDDFVRRGTH